jgi:glycosyltransferase involved in cell wall biosynthesis
VIDILERLEFPSEIRSYLTNSYNKPGKINAELRTPNIPAFLDGLSFPFLASSVILSAHFTSAHVLYKSRPLLNEFAEQLDYLKHPERMLWLTDTYGDSNGVSMVLKSILKQIQIRNLPIDILVCSDSIIEEDHLYVLKTVTDFKLPFYKQQSIRIPDFLELNRFFLNGEYDRIICSTEGPMGLATLYLKNAYTVPCYFYIHTDWISFGQKVLNMEKNISDRFRRILRAYYKEFDGVFVLNNDHYKWLTGRKMEIRDSSVFLTAHWVDEWFKPVLSDRSKMFGFESDGLVVLYAGRLSLEKGVMELPLIYKIMSNELPGLKLVVAGSGPAEQDLREALPEATYLGWVNPELLPAIYSSADLLLLPSKFDTFSCVVLEALSCGLPVIAYRTKGPKDIIMNGINGFLVKTLGSFALKATEYLKDKISHQAFREAAIRRSNEYTADRIIHNLLNDVGLIEPMRHFDGKEHK